MKQALLRAGLTGLMATGLLLPILSTLGLLSNPLVPLPTALFLSLLLGVSTWKPWLKTMTAIFCIIILVVYLSAMGGASVAIEVLRGLLLHASGLNAALPLIATRASLLLTMLITCLSFLLTGKGIGGIPALMAVILCGLLLWLGSCEQALWLMIPALTSALSLMVLSRYEELRPQRILPAMAILASAAIFLVPAGGVTIPPLKEGADTLRQRLMDYLFFTEPRDVFSLASEGFYPEGINQLGGKASPTPHAVMEVLTPRTTYLRGVVKNEYTGRTWQDTTGGRRYLWISKRYQPDRVRLFNMDLISPTLRESNLLQVETLSVRMLSEGQSTLFVPQRVETISTTGDLVPYFNNSSEVFITRNLVEGDTYSLTASLVTAGENGLEHILESCQQSGDPSTYEQISRLYTALPGHLQSHVFEIAQRAIEGASTPYEKAFAIQNYLRRSYHYTLDVPPQSADVDFVSNFLLATKEGYCTHFASAMTVLCRMVGLPARYVEGYLVTPNGEGVALVTGEQAHAWTEVYFDGFGWLTFDATPPKPESGSGNPPPPPNPPPPEEEPIPTPEPEDTPQETPPPQSEEQPTQPPPVDNLFQREEQTPPLWWPFFLLLLMLALIALRVWLVLPDTKAKRTPDQLACWMIYLQALLEAAWMMGWKRNNHESAAAFLLRLGEATHQQSTARLIADCTNEVFYGGCVPSAEDITQCRHAVQTLLHGMKWSQKSRWLLRRFFLREQKRNLLTKKKEG